MDQDDSPHKHGGHPEITREAVHILFQSGRAHDGLIDGMTEDQYFAKLNAAQKYQDRPTGPTPRPHYLAEAEQREHAMADPNLTGTQNLDRDREYIVDELTAAHDARGDAAMKHLGAAVHALEDSYSEAHMWRGDTAHAGDPHAPVVSINVFDPLGHSPQSPGWPGVEGTHDPTMDQVPVDVDGNAILGVDRAAIAAVAEALEHYEDDRRDGSMQARLDFELTVGADMHAQPGLDVAVNNSYEDPAWQAEHARRLEIQQLQSEGVDTTGI